MAAAGTSATAVLRDLMTTPVAATTPEASVAAAAADMVRVGVGSAMVMQGSFLVGILTERDVLKAAASGADLSASGVSEWMTPDPQTATPGMSAEDAAERVPAPAGRGRPHRLRRGEPARPVRGQDPPPAAGLSSRRAEQWMCC